MYSSRKRVPMPQTKPVETMRKEVSEQCKSAEEFFYLIFGFFVTLAGALNVIRWKKKYTRCFGTLMSHYCDNLLNHGKALLNAFLRGTKHKRES